MCSMFYLPFGGEPIGVFGGGFGGLGSLKKLVPVLRHKVEIVFIDVSVPLEGSRR